MNSIFKFALVCVMFIVVSCSDNKEYTPIIFKLFKGEKCVINEKIQLNKSYTKEGLIYNYSRDKNNSEFIHSLELSGTKVIFDSDVYNCDIVNKKDYLVEGKSFSIKRISCTSEINDEKGSGYVIFINDSLGLLIVNGAGVYNHYTTFSESNLTDNLIVQVLKDKEFVYPIGEILSSSAP